MADQLANQAHGLACQLAFCHVHYLMHVQMALHLGAAPGQEIS
jgi:hypothetical protein